MADLNVFCVPGRLTRDAELRHSNDGKPVLKLSLASESGYGEFKHVNYFDLVMFGDRAANSAQYFTKGKPLSFVLEAKQNRWEDKDTQAKRSAVNFIVKDFQYLPDGGRGNDFGYSDGGGGGQQGQGGSYNEQGGRSNQNNGQSNAGGQQRASTGQYSQNGQARTQHQAAQRPGVLSNDDFSDDIPF